MCLRRVDAAGEQHRRHLARLLRQFASGPASLGDRVQIDHAVDAFVAVLQAPPSCGSRRGSCRVGQCRRAGCRRRRVAWRRPVSEWGRTDGRSSAGAQGWADGDVRVASIIAMGDHHAAHTRLPSSAPELRRSGRGDRLVHAAVPKLHEGRLGRLSGAAVAKQRHGAVHQGRRTAANRAAERDLAFRLARHGRARKPGNLPGPRGCSAAAALHHR